MMKPAMLGDASMNNAMHCGVKEGPGRLSAMVRDLFVPRR